MDKPDICPILKARGYNSMHTLDLFIPFKLGIEETCRGKL